MPECPHQWELFDSNDPEHSGLTMVKCLFCEELREGATD